MPLIGGRLGWNEPPPAATTSPWSRTPCRASVVTRNAGSSDALERFDHLAEMEGRPERLDLLHQVVGEALPGDVGKPGMS